MTMNGLEWLAKERRIPVELCLDMGVSEVNHPNLGPALAFPYRRTGEKPYAAKFRTFGDRKDWRSTHGVSRGFYNEEDLDRNFSYPILITEGEIDTLSLKAAGAERVVSLPDGWDEASGKADVLTSEETRLRQAPFVVVAGDTDKAGLSLGATVANVLEGMDVRVCAWPDGCKDANDVLRKFGARALMDHVAEAKRIDPDGGEFLYIGDKTRHHARRILRTGDNVFDDLMAFEIGQISILTGQPGVGKTTFGTFITKKVRRAENVRCGLLCMETHIEQLQDHLTMMECGRPWSDMTDEAREQARMDLGHNYVMVKRQSRTDVDFHMKWLHTILKTLAIREGCRFIFIDPWNELDHYPEPGESFTRYVDWALKTLRIWAEDLGIHIMLAAHPKKPASGEKNRIPTGYDIADSAAFFNKASIGLTVAEKKKDDDREDAVQIMNWKVRDMKAYGCRKQIKTVQFDSHSQVYRRYM